SCGWKSSGTANRRPWRSSTSDLPFSGAAPDTPPDIVGATDRVAERVAGVVVHLMRRLLRRATFPRWLPDVAGDLLLQTRRVSFLHQSLIRLHQAVFEDVEARPPVLLLRQPLARRLEARQHFLEGRYRAYLTGAEILEELVILRVVV